MTRSRDTSKVGKDARTKGKETFYVNAKQFDLLSVDPAPLNNYNNTNGIPITGLGFYDNQTKYAFYNCVLPKSYDGGMLSYKLYFYLTSTNSHSVGFPLSSIWRMDSVNIRTDSTVLNGDVAALDTQDFTPAANTNGTVGYLQHTILMPEVPLSFNGSVILNPHHLITSPYVDFKPHREWVEGVTLSSFRLLRDGAADSVGATCNLLGVQFQYTTDLPNDD
jgi:hypothetical protein